MDRYEIDNYYTASEVAEMLGLDKNTILYRCKKQQYEGAIKTAPSSGDPHGKWLIPKCSINVPTMTKDVVNLTRQINPLELQRVITHAIDTAVTHAVTHAVEQLNNKIDEQAALIKQQSEIIERLKNEHYQVVNQTIEIYRKINEIKSEVSQLKPHTKKSFWASLWD